MGLMKPCLEVVPNRATTFAFGFLRKTKSRIEHIVTLVIDCLLPFGVGDFDACMRQPCAIGIVHNTVIQKISAKTHLCRRRHVRRKQEGEWERVRPRCHVLLDPSATSLERMITESFARCPGDRSAIVLTRPTSRSFNSGVVCIGGCKGKCSSNNLVKPGREHTFHATSVDSSSGLCRYQETRMRYSYARNSQALSSPVALRFLQSLQTLGGTIRSAGLPWAHVHESGCFPVPKLGRTVRLCSNDLVRGGGLSELLLPFFVVFVLFFVCHTSVFRALRTLVE